MADIISDEVKLIRSIIQSSEAKFVIVSSTESNSILFNRNTGNLQSSSATVKATSLQSFKVGENKVKYLFKVE